MTTLDLLGNEIPPSTGPDWPRDVATEATTRLTLRRAAIKAKRIFIRMVLICLTIAIILLGLGVWYAYSTRVEGRLTDTRACTWKLGDSDLTGSRSYSYPYLEVLGIRSLRKDKIEETTTLNLNGSGITIIGLNGDNWWAVNTKDGERGTQTLKPADSYVFQSGKNISVVKYGAFCK